MMKRFLRKIPTVLILIFMLTPAVLTEGAEKPPSNEPVTYSAEAVREDLTFLYETLKISSYDLYLNTSKADYDKAFEQVMSSIDAPMTYLEISRLVRPFVVLAGFVHLWSDFPSEAYREFRDNGGSLVPFEISFWKGKVLISANWSDNDRIEPGDEILTVNGTDIRELLEEIYAYKQGGSEYAKRTFLETGSLMANWWFVFGEFEVGTLHVRKRSGEEVSTEVTGLTFNILEERKSTGGSPSHMKEGRTFEFIGDVAYLRPGDFLNLGSHDISSQETFNNEEFLGFIDAAFADISSRKSQNLILDLRGNYGGDNSFSDPMIAYFADRPFQIASKFSVRTSPVTKAFWKDVDIPELADMKHQILTLEDGARFEVELNTTQPRDDDLAFKGDVIALIDRFSFSNTSAVAAILQDYGFGILIGEETADTPSSCGAIHAFELPNTHMEIMFPKACMVRPSGDARLRGVTPDYRVKDDPFTQEDEVLDAALKLIEMG